MCVHNALVLIYYVQYTESTAGHMCVQSEIVFSAKSNAERKAYMVILHLCQITMSNTQRALQGTYVCNLRSIFLQSQMQVESIYVHVALVLIVNVQYTESPAGNMCVKYEIVFSHNQMQSDSIYVHVALLLSE